MRWYAVLFWIWVVASLAIFVWRRLNRPRDDTPALDPEPTESPLTKQWAPPPPDPDAPVADVVATPGDPSPDPGPAAPPPGGGSPTARAPSAGASSTGAPSLAELLQGISLPHDLVPLTQALPASGPVTSLVAATSTASPEQVGAALADEIERLGYVVSTTGAQTAMAEGPRGAIEIEVHPNASTATDGGQLKFPTAPAGSVVVELRVAGTRR